MVRSHALAVDATRDRSPVQARGNLWLAAHFASISPGSLNTFVRVCGGNDQAVDGESLSRMIEQDAAIVYERRRQNGADVW